MRPEREREPERERLCPHGGRAGVRAWLPWMGAWALLLAVVVGAAPLTAHEGGLVAASAGDDWLSPGSPLFSIALRLVAVLGPPADVALRFVLLASLLAGGIAGARVCAELGASRRAHVLAAVCLTSHGALVAAASRLGPSIVVWACEAVLLALALAMRRAGRTPPRWLAALAAVSGVLVLVEPATTPMILVLATWLARAPSGRGAAAAVIVPAVAGVGLAVIAFRTWSSTGLVVPDIEALASAVVGLAPPADRVAPAHRFVVAAAPAALVVLSGLAVSGWIRSRWDLRILSLGLALPSLALSCLDGGSMPGVLAMPPLIILGAVRIDTLGPGADRAFWTCVLVGLSVATGIGAVTSPGRPETRAVAGMLAPETRVAVSDPRLGAAIDFYRPRVRRDGAAVRVWQPGDRTPRAVVVHAFGTRIGRLWVVRPGRPLFDAMAQLEEATVSYSERGRTIPCPWQRSRERFFCGGPEYQAVMRTSAELDGAMADAIYFPPLDDGVLEIRWDRVALGRRLVGLAGLADQAIDFSSEPVSIEVRAGSAPAMTLERGARRGLIPFEIETAGGPDRGAVVMRVSTRDDRGRHVFVDAVTVP